MNTEVGRGRDTIAPRIAVVIPCLNEALTIAQVVRDFQTQLPGATVYVFDNGSSDETVAEAHAAGAKVFTEKRRGKGFVVQTMFQQVDAEVFVMVDGDNTYPAAQVTTLIAPVLAGQADMVVGSRITRQNRSEFRWLNRVGNLFYLHLINVIFGTRLTDILSGYRAMNRRLVKGLPLFLTGFEVETELTIKALQGGYRIEERPVDLRARPEGSRSKIRILRDGWKILSTILALFRDYKPLAFFGGPGVILMLMGVLLGLIPIGEYLRTGLVPHFPSALLAVGMVISGMLLGMVGIILHTINRRFQEMGYFSRLLLEQRK